MAGEDQGWTDVQQDEGWQDVQSAATQTPETPKRPFLTRLKEFGHNVFNPDQAPSEEKPVNDVPASPFTIPGGKTALAEGLKRAQTIANAGVGVGDTAMGMPSANVAGLAGDVASVGAEGAKAIGRGVEKVLPSREGIARAMRVKEGTGALKPPVRGIAAAAGAAGGYMTGGWPTAMVGRYALPATVDWATPRAAVPVAPDLRLPIGERIALTKPWGRPPSMMAGTSTAPESVASIPPEALPGIAKGAMSSTGAEPTTPLGTPPTKPEPPSMIAGTPTQGPQGTTPMELPAPGSVPQPKEVQLTPKAAAIKQGVTEGAQANEPNFTGNEGRPATWTNEAVRQFAAKGNRDAISQAVRRGLGLQENERYVMGDPDYPRAVLNPREVTKFTPEGTPIRNAENPLAQNPSSRARIQQPEMPAARVEPAAPELTKAARIGEGAVKNRPEWTAQQFDSEIARAKGILRNPEATPEDRLHAERVIESSREMQGATGKSEAIAEGVKQSAPNFRVTPPPENVPTPRVPQPREQLGNFDADTLEQAKQEIGAANSEWQGRERPGRFFTKQLDEFGNAQRQEMTHSISSGRPDLETAYPWLKNLPKMTPEKLRAAVESGKGVEYTRLLNEAAHHIQAAKEAAGPLLDEFRGELESKAQAIEAIDPDLAQTLRDLSAGKYSGMTGLSRFIRERLDEAANAEALDKAISDASAEEAAGGTEEGNQESSAVRGSNPQETQLGVLPGMQDAVAQQRIAVGVEQGRQLTEKLNQPPKSIEAAAGEMERLSPLFRGTEASPQDELFGSKRKPRQ